MGNSSLRLCEVLKKYGSEISNVQTSDKHVIVAQLGNVSFKCLHQKLVDQGLYCFQNRA